MRYGKLEALKNSEAKWTVPPLRKSVRYSPEVKNIEFAPEK